MDHRIEIAFFEINGCCLYTSVSVVSTVKWWGTGSASECCTGWVTTFVWPRLPVRAGFCKECEADVAEVVGRYGGVGCM